MRSAGRCRTVTEAHFRPTGRNLYVSNDDNAGGVAVFVISPSAGVAIQLAGKAGCITTDGSSDGTPGKCTAGRTLSTGYGMSVSPNGKSVYQATDDGSQAGLAIYRRKTAPPKLSGLHVSGHVGRLRIGFRLTVPALVTIKFSRSSHALAGELVEKGRAGANQFTFAGKVGGHLLGRGTYQATATPVGGNPKKTTFTLRP